MEANEAMDTTLASMERLARTVLETTTSALSLKQNMAIYEETQITAKTATDLLAYSEVGQCASVEAEKRAALDRATELVQEMNAGMSWVRRPIPELAFVHSASRKQ
jgi:hypothetical protein